MNLKEEMLAWFDREVTQRLNEAGIHRKFVNEMDKADAELVRLKLNTGKNITAILEDLLLQRRQFSAPVETWLDAEAARRCRSRAEIIERVLVERMCRYSNFPPLGVNPDAVAQQEGGAAIVSVETKKVIENQPEQIPGCLPRGYDRDSLLTVEQFAIWRQTSIRTARAALPITKGVIRRSRQDVRIHPRSYLELSLKKRYP